MTTDGVFLRDVDNKLRILAPMKAIWRERLTTLFPCQGHDALEPEIVVAQPAADFTIAHVGALADLDPTSLIKQQAAKACTNQEKQ